MITENLRGTKVDVLKEHGRVLIVDDEWYILDFLSHLVTGEGFEPLVACDGPSALRMVRTETPDVMLLDVRLPEMDGMEVLKKVKDLDPNLPVIMMTAHAEVQSAVEAMRQGAHDYLSKPFETHEVVRVIRRAFAERNLKRKVENLSTQLRKDLSLSKLMGPSDAVARLISDVNHVAKSEFTVVIQGETGSGKELVARFIHRSSRRSEGPFVAVDCGAIPETLLESELFGHERGAFTGAIQQKAGKFEAAKGGTLLLDEISNMSLGSQAKLLRGIQERKIYRVGGTKPTELNVRLLVASNLDLEALVASDSFRRDLFYRLNEFSIKIPPLRKRREDIPYLAKRFLEDTSAELGKCVDGFTESAMESLLSYDWPGNVRELRSAIRRAVLLADGVVTDDELNLEAGPRPAASENTGKRKFPWREGSLREIVKGSVIAVERQVLSQALAYTGGNKAKAARLLQIDYKTMHTKVRQLGIDTPFEH
jgi:DNA-binding NtrC family response regulator